MKDLKDFFILGLRDMYWVEKKLVSELKRWAEQARHDELKEALLNHREETQNQVERLEEIFSMLDLSPRAEKCDAMEGILEEAEIHMEKSKTDELFDAVMIGAGNKIEHYEIASYGTLREYAGKLGMDDAVELLQLSLDEEAAADEKLTMLAENRVNAEALLQTS